MRNYYFIFFRTTFTILATILAIMVPLEGFGVSGEWGAYYIGCLVGIVLAIMWILTIVFWSSKNE